MIDPNTIFQRTQSGRDEIHHKSHGLTQSERLVLIMIDGVNSYQAVRVKLPSLTDDRFHRALLTLQQKELAVEVFMPLADQPAEELEQAVVDRFLYQDPMDPVTMIFVDPEEELGMPQPSPVAPKSQTAPKPEVGPDFLREWTASSSAEPTSVERTEEERVIDELAALAATVEKEVRSRQPMHNSRLGPLPQPFPQVVMRAKPEAAARPSLLKSFHWGYWSIGIGVAFIGGFFLAHLTH